MPHMLMLQHCLSPIEMLTQFQLHQLLFLPGIILQSFVYFEEGEDISGDLTVSLEVLDDHNVWQFENHD